MQLRHDPNAGQRRRPCFAFGPRHRGLLRTPRLCGGLVLAALVPVTAAATGLPSLTGTFRFVAQQSDDINHAIDRAIRTMNVLERPFARHRLRTINTPYPRLRIRVTPDAVLIVADRRAPIRMPLTGAPVAWRREDGEPFTVRGMWEGSVFEQTFASGTGRRVNSYQLSPDGQTLTIRVVVTGGGLPRPMRYHIVYRRIS
jgi:hypothetical protein